MHPIPKKMRDELSEDDNYRLCIRGKLGFTSECEGRIEWHHIFTYAGRQIQEKWAIISLCQFHHSSVKEQKSRKIVEWVALNRLFHLPEKEFLEMEVKYKKAFQEWKRKLIFLNKLYGRYHGDKRN